MLEKFYKSILCFLVFFIFLSASSAQEKQPSIKAINPKVINIDSTVEIKGENLNVLKEASEIKLAITGKFTDTIGEGFDVILVLNTSYANNETLLASIDKKFMKAISYAHGFIKGEASISYKIKEIQSEMKLANVQLEVFPPSILNSMTGLLESFNIPSFHHFWIFIVVLGIVALFILLIVFALFAGITSWFERRVAGRIQSRIGPNRVGPQGFLQWLADGLKVFQKEDFIPPVSLKFLFRIAPYFAMVGVLLTFATLPFGQFLVVSDLNVGIFYIIAVTGFVVIGILLAGFTSNNKWSLLGGLRSAAQIISYEIPSGIAILSIVILSGTLSMQGIIGKQGGLPWDWFIFHNPATAICFIIYIITMLAEGNRTPFDLPEAEQELVSGYNTEYSGMRFVFFFFAEWGNLYIMGAILVTIFLGGWQIPFVPAIAHENNFLIQLIGWFVFTLKSLLVVFFVIWIRWTLPRIRIDQMMEMCWKYLVPIGIVSFLFSAGFGAFAPSWLKFGTKYILFGLSLVLLVFFIKKYIYNQKRARAELYLSPFI